MDARAVTPRTWWMVVMLFLAADFTAARVLADDRDNDGIQDAYEAQLIQRFAPNFYWHSFQESNRGIPVSISWFVENSVIRDESGNSVASFPTLDQAVALIGTGVGTRFWKLDLLNEVRHGDSSLASTSIPEAIVNGDGIYARVWRPWDDYPDFYSIQYHMLQTWNEADSGAPLDPECGDHEGDWLAVDFGVDVSRGPGNERLMHGIYHNHGGQFYVAREALWLTPDGRPMVFLEDGPNEFWPNPGGGGDFAWPDYRGMAGNRDINKEDALALRAVYRPHRGEGYVYDTSLVSIPNIGEYDGIRYVSLTDDNEGRFFFTFQGTWGEENNDCDILGQILFGINNPRSPIFQQETYPGKVWGRRAGCDPTGERRGSAALWVSDDARGTCTDATGVDTPEWFFGPYGGDITVGGSASPFRRPIPDFFAPVLGNRCFPEQDGPTVDRTWTTSSFTPQVWASPNGNDMNCGHRISPVRSAGQANALVHEYGKMFFAPGSYPGPITIDKAMIIELDPDAGAGTAVIGN